jgi:aryl-alcohol dehydrogenase-like predicted oxidoreductase
MGLARLPLVLIHWPDANTPLEDTMEALMRLREEGKLGDVGVSNFAAGQIRQAHSLMELSGIQAQFSLLRRETETEIVPECLSLQLGVMAWGVLAQGLLSGKYSAGSPFPANDRRSVHPNCAAAHRSRLSNTNATVRVVAERHGVRPAQVAIRWVLDQAGISAAIVGIKTRDQLRDMLRASSLRLTDEDRHLLGNRTMHSIAAKRDANAN